MGRLIIISNRLPFSLDREGDKLTLRQSSGGLVSAIKSYFESNSNKDQLTEKLWMGVADFPQEDWDQAVASHVADQDFSVIPLYVDNTLYDNYYNGFSNSVLWPLFHYFSSLAIYDSKFFDAYVQMNQLFAEKLAPLLRPDDQVWVHDYQLMLLPHLLRQKRQDATIGFFLHIPFPSYEIFRLLPTEWKKILLQGVMGADLIGFHTYDYVQHFLQSVKMLLGVDNYFHNLQYQDRLVRIDLFPIGIDYNKFSQAANDPEVMDMCNKIRHNLEDKKIIFSVDRLDYTKGLPSRLSGFEYFLERYPEWREKMVFILNIVPSRSNIPAYLERKKMIEEKIGMINGRFSTISWQPVIYRYNHLSFKELIALYQAADVALITPLRDGMNLVAKEYVASCTSGRGVLILSELAGAVSELSEAILVNPTDTADVASSITRALAMPLYEQRNRLALMQRRLQEYDVIKWVNDFMDQLTQVKQEQQKQKVKILDDKALAAIRKHYGNSKNRCLLLDYDGTLVPFTRLPSEASPDNAVKEMLARLTGDPRNHVIVISGRDVSSLDRWLGALPVTLVAEHGASFKMRNSGWQQMVSVSDMWKEEIRRVMQLFVIRCAGSFIEEKTNTIAWHYRNTQTGLGFSRSRELLNTLSQLIQNTTLQVIDGNKVVEVRIAGFDKGATALKIVNESDPDFVLCIGDDTTDEDMFKALEGEAYTIKVNNGASAAQYTILSQTQVLPLLNMLATPLSEPLVEHLK
ncbi:bifunctional alpha,alpha-trehalose-phosphate synthase (UDP-forming)/trehalose-phosphatase [Flavitalea sp. BT771]|uniref:bifunctional alpha,alpha-trehalose-phosphate synthase (UDP-forming)/trehalose-phosphatase n=1 Tax=Flavitalea sp. BT771 TaxID=3063329 RepID=UPI0026E2F745|nr:bifunctional alpha,alpha-trehalose-phosphate synthase (UDP-forming)/trehalose-phosphatase [Flavitalea sp. BT771]MDO6431434.1 bifunctional alpha,alpha-trehalose-phosphate synthase (UDP-forming)/trehalose-phosphatase [Flavitalea sp. BT771]MDV6220342.1 bifunctional alpha,alpha-trehalose-phosphate synthase (UDP-forming)/trehalose-phosphatase [Flavitalea sp. BT771]